MAVRLPQFVHVSCFHTVCLRLYLPAGGLILCPLFPLHTGPVGRELAEIVLWPAPGPTTHTLPAGHGLAEGSLRLALEPELDSAPLLMCLCSVQLFCCMSLCCYSCCLRTPELIYRHCSACMIRISERSQRVTVSPVMDWRWERMQMCVGSIMAYMCCCVL